KNRLGFITGIVVLAVILTSCGDSFLNTKPKDSISLSNFYASNAQVEASTNILYDAPWFGWNNKASWSITEMQAGNGRSYSNDVVSFNDFSTQGDNPVIGSGWASLWTVNAQSNALINNLPQRVASEVDQSTIDNALGEAHLMRAAAYFYLVRTWGPVPIITNNLDHVEDPAIPLNRVQDIYQFMRNDLQFCIDNCVDIASGLNTGHVTSGSAKAMLAKVALYQEDYDTARQMSEEVINSGQFQLLEDYSALFKVENNNNLETIIALQWAGDSYGVQNSIQASSAYNNEITGTGDGYSVLGPTIDIQRAYESGDQRRKPSIMLGGAHYPGILSDDGGYTVPEDVNAQGTNAAMKKYVVGTPTDQGGAGAAQASVINTYILRYADLLLIHAESILANSQSTSDPAALESFNKVRERAGLQGKTSITMDDILHERRIELAFESDYWYDLGRIDRSKAIEMISNQERGTFANTPREDPPVINSIMLNPSAEDFLLPYPSPVVAVNDNFTKDPVPYDFGDE